MSLRAKVLMLAIALVPLASSGCREEEPEGIAQKNTSAPKADASPETAKVGDTPCRAICTTAQALDCKNSKAQCLAMCEGMLRVDVCRPEMADSLECMANVPVEGWGCGDEGFPQLKSGYCEDAQAAMVACMAMAE